MLLSTEAGEVHGLINELPNSNRGTGFEHMKPEHKKEMEAKKKESKRMVKARYINHRGPNERLESNYCEFSGEPIKCYRLIPGHTYELPRGFVDQVNNFGKIANRKSIEEPGDHHSTEERPQTQLHELVPVEF